MYALFIILESLSNSLPPWFLPHLLLFFSIYRSLKIPNYLVDQARERGFDKFTVGDQLALQYNKNNKSSNSNSSSNDSENRNSNTVMVNSKDPHSFLTRNASPRVDLLQQVVKTALGQLLFNLQ